MNKPSNQFGQPAVTEVPGWQGASYPPLAPMDGRFCRVEPLDVKAHLDDPTVIYPPQSRSLQVVRMRVGECPLAHNPRIASTGEKQ